jgi:hypothetical protein
MPIGGGGGILVFKARTYIYSQWRRYKKSSFQHKRLSYIYVEHNKICSYTEATNYLILFSTYNLLQKMNPKNYTEKHVLLGLLTTECYNGPRHMEGIGYKKQKYAEF